VIYTMAAILAAVLFVTSRPSAASTGQLVGRIADLTEVSLSPMIASGPGTKWEMLGRTLDHLPWAREALQRPDLIEGWQQAFDACPLPRRRLSSNRFDNLLSLLTFPPIVRKETGHERELLGEVVRRCIAAKRDWPEGPIVRFARVAFPQTQIARLYDGLVVTADGASISFPGKRSLRQYESNRERAKLELVRLVGGS
jgi:hypothetical protein